jgi:hypothetical protein
MAFPESEHAPDPGALVRRVLVQPDGQEGKLEPVGQGRQIAHLRSSSQLSNFSHELESCPLRETAAGVNQSFTARKRSALPTTESELRLMAALAHMGLMSKPNIG